MKLNLLPQTASKGRGLRTAFVLGTLLVLLGLGLAAVSVNSANGELKRADDRVADAKQAAADAVATSKQADDTVAAAAGLIRNATLAQDMLDHNKVYPDLYAEVKMYIPSFFRVTSMSAAPVDGSSCTVTLTGTLQTYQQYADLMLALMRDPNATSISRSGFNYDPTIVPGLSESDPIGVPRKQDEAPVPKDQLERLAYYQSRQNTSGGYLGVGNFGGDPSAERGATPSESLITVVITMKKDIQVPNIEATLAESAVAQAPASTGAPIGGPPGAMMGGPGAGLAGPPPGVPGPGGAPAAGASGTADAKGGD